MRERARLAGAMAGVTAAYVLAGLVGLTFAAPHPAATAVWPPAGIAVAALLVFGVRAWPAAAVGAFVVNVFVLEHVAAAAVIAAGNTLEYILAAVLTNRVARGRLAFSRGGDVFRFAFVAALLAPALAAVIGTSTLLLSGLAVPSDGWVIGLTWWLGDATGIALYAPFCVLLAAPRWERRAGRGELAAGALVLIVLLYSAFGLPAAVQRDVPFAMLILPVMLWSAFRVDPRATAMLGITMSVVGVHRMVNDLGPFELGVPAEALLVVQSIVAIFTLLMLAVSAEAGIRRRVEAELRLLNESLERRVQERTAEVTRLHGRLVEAQAVAQLGSWEWEVATNRLWWSDELCRIFGVPAAPDGYAAYLQLIHPDERELADRHVRVAMQTGAPYGFEHRLVRPDGDIRAVQANGRVELDETGAPRRLLGTAHDITERLRAEEARAQLIREQAKLREAEESNRAKDAFLAILSHELRTPLNAALGWTHILRDALRTGRPHDRVVEAIHRNLQLQARIVSDILDISRITKGELPLEWERVDIRVVFDAAVDIVRAAAAAKGITIHTRSVGLPEVPGDSRRLQQVAWNLLSNAVKFAADSGHVTVSIVDTGAHVECAVEDDGPGIAPAFLPHVFEQFRQGDSSTTREHGGLGLGLAIAHEIVTLHEGTIDVSNRPEGGARFLVRLPKTAADAGSVRRGGSGQAETTALPQV